MATPNPHTPGHRSPSCDNHWLPWPTPRSPTSSAAVHLNTTSSIWNSSFAGHVAAKGPKIPADQGKSRIHGHRSIGHRFQATGLESRTLLTPEEVLSANAFAAIRTDQFDDFRQRYNTVLTSVQAAAEA